tara:strand:+ start:786 stop:977 length:192 start_codon:yes stop_codon:yes gene_type:complete
MNGPGDRLKAFMQKFRNRKNGGQVVGKSSKLDKKLTGNPVKDEQLLYPDKFKKVIDSDVVDKN